MADLEIETASGAGRLTLDRPRNAKALLVLTHGAGGDPDTADIMAVHRAALADAIAVARVTQPYRVAGRSSPAKPGPQDEAWLAIVASLRKRRGLGTLPLIVGGRSNGARVACRTATASGAVGVIALAFPLHPPGRPELSRLDELEAAHVPVLVVQGDRDPFGMPPPGDDREIVVIPGTGHSLRGDIDAVAVAAMAAVTTMMGRARVGS